MHMDADEETAMADLQAIATGQPPPSQQAYAATTKQQAPSQQQQSQAPTGDSDDEVPINNSKRTDVVPVAGPEQDDA